MSIETIFAPGGLTGRAPENIEWSPDGKLLSYVQRNDSGDHGELWSIDPNTGQKRVLVSESKLATLAPDVNTIKNEIQREKITRYSVAAYHWGPDSKHLLFDSLGQLWLYSLDSGTAVEFTSAPEPSEDPKFSPDGTRVAYIRRHNLYARPTSGGDEKQLTRNDKKDVKDDDMLNGEVDWVYEEELFVRSNYFWSPDSSQIAFLAMDETRVPTYPIVDLLPLTAEVQNQKYPKPGDPNPLVRLGVISAKGGGLKWISLTDNSDVYIPRFGWVRDGVLWAEVLNRPQDTLELYFIEAKSGRSRKVLTETSKEAWINVNDANMDDFHVLRSGDRFLWSSWRDGHTHLYLYSFDRQNPLAGEAKLEKQLEQGDYEMLGVKGIDEKSGTVYVAANQGDPRQEQLYSVKLDGTGLEPVSHQPGTHTVKFADDGQHYADMYSANLIPPKRSVCAASGSPCYSLWESRSVAQYDWLRPTDLELKAADGTLPLYGQLLMPTQSPSGGKIPLIVEIYGGPAGQTVRNTWGAGVTDPFEEMMAQEGYAIFSVDNRGTPNRGRDFMASAIHHQFGSVELKDQLAALDQLFRQNPSLDNSRVCIWGWSNGGSMTMYSLLHSKAYKCGVAGAPVTDWRLYDSTYTERYLGVPKDKPKSYEESAMPPLAEHLNGSLLLIHGTSDDNVHVQNSIAMVNSLINAKKQFRLMFYPGKTHGVTGDARIHLFHMVQDFLEDNLR
ncbi:MAG: S9 family peptidase [Acidobacteria bacterium]|nr:S9 family peptidase [Acidobacteriota bacterium]